jgi:hypothetical protein
VVSNGQSPSAMVQEAVRNTIVTENNPVSLTEDEIEILEALQGQINASIEAYIRPVQAKFANRIRRLEQRLALKPGAIGTTHIIKDNLVMVRFEESEALSS